MGTNFAPLIANLFLFCCGGTFCCLFLVVGGLLLLMRLALRPDVGKIF